MRLMISLMTIVAVIILGIAVFVITHLTGLSLTQGIILICLGVVGLIMVMIILLLFMRGIQVKKK